METFFRNIGGPASDIFDDDIHQDRNSFHEDDTTMQQRNEFHGASPLSSSSSAVMDYYTINDMGQPQYAPLTYPTLHRQPSELSLNDQQGSEPSTPVPSAAFAGWQHPLAEVDMELLDVYFQNVHPYLPMLDRNALELQIRADQPPMMLLFAMCAVAARWAPAHRNTAHAAPPGFNYYRRAFALIDVTNAAPCISSIQALVLLAKYLEQYTRTGYFYRPSYYLGIAVEMCNALNLAALTPAMCADPLDYETKKRTFWTLYLFDIWTSIEEGREMKFSTSGCTMDYPVVTMDGRQEDMMARHNMVIRLGRKVAKVYEFARQLQSRQQVQGAVRTAQQQVHEEGQLLVLQTDLDKFLHELSLIPSFDYAPSTKTDKYPADAAPIQDAYVAFVHMMYHYAILLLHRHYVLYPMNPHTDQDVPMLPAPASSSKAAATASSSSSSSSSLSSSSTTAAATTAGGTATGGKTPTFNHRQLCAVSASIINGIVDTLLKTQALDVFHYPIRGAQWSILCLTMAKSVHEFEMGITPPNDPRHTAAATLHRDALTYIQQLAPESPAFEIHQLAKDAELAELCGDKLAVDASRQMPPPSSSASSSPVLSASTAGSVTAALTNTRLNASTQPQHHAPPPPRRLSASSAHHGHQQHGHPQPYPQAPPAAPSSHSFQSTQAHVQHQSHASTAQKRVSSSARSTTGSLDHAMANGSSNASPSGRMMNPALYNSSGILTNPARWANMYNHVPHLSMPPFNHHQQPIQPPANTTSTIHANANANPKLNTPVVPNLRRTASTLPARKLHHHYSQGDIREIFNRGPVRPATNSPRIEGSRLKKHKSTHFSMASQQAQHAIHKYPPPTSSSPSSSQAVATTATASVTSATSATSSPTQAHRVDASPSPSVLFSTPPASSTPLYSPPAFQSPQQPSQPLAQHQQLQPQQQQPMAHAGGPSYDPQAAAAAAAATAAAAAAAAAVNPVHRRHTISFSDAYAHHQHMDYASQGVYAPPQSLSAASNAPFSYMPPHQAPFLSQPMPMDVTMTPSLPDQPSIHQHAQNTQQQQQPMPIHHTDPAIMLDPFANPFLEQGMPWGMQMDMDRQPSDHSTLQ
ncbi:fungal-specific transcription factor domain-containing protein [Gongronella butleri]|nr:fungal-specific transcription factor domain-containing protein [Gongronella butleri]